MTILVMIQDKDVCRLVEWSGRKEVRTVAKFDGRVEMKHFSKAYAAATRQCLYNMKKDGKIVEVYQ